MYGGNTPGLLREHRVRVRGVRVLGGVRRRVRICGVGIIGGVKVVWILGGIIVPRRGVGFDMLPI
jgi:hypothetical protein